MTRSCAFLIALATATSTGALAACPKPIDAAVADAQKMLKANNPGGAFLLMTTCRAEIKTPQHQATYKQALLATQKADKDRKRKEGVSVGMTAQDVLDSQWGRPTRVNTTHTSRGTREQWVYSQGNYLYFENGILRSVQTRN